MASVLQLGNSAEIDGLVLYHCCFGTALAVGNRLFGQHCASVCTTIGHVKNTHTIDRNATEIVSEKCV